MLALNFFKIASRTFEIEQDCMLLQIVVLLLKFFVVWDELEVAADLTTIFDNFSCKILHASAIV